MAQRPVVQACVGDVKRSLNVALFKVYFTCQEEEVMEQ